jgi:class 3 adenylate cyclase
MHEQNPNSPSAAAAVPLKVSEDVIGVLTVESFSATLRGFSDHDGALLSALADYAAIAIENAHQSPETRVGGASTETLVSPFTVPIAPLPSNDVIPSRREVTILFADLRGQNTLSERAEPDAVIGLLNRYFMLAIEAIGAQGGTIDGYLGEGVIAIFNAPGDQLDHNRRAIQSALAIQNAVTEFNAANNTALQFSIGVAQGVAIVGNVGAAPVLTYTAIGEPVGIAKRLQERADAGQIFVEENAFKDIPESSIDADRLGELNIKGRKAPVVVYLLKDLT